ncbi:MAG: hypothetical protein U0K87_12495 [Ruminococcus sp.]|nr:hypothetical protein [Ruminococcus sp.]
MEVKQIYDIMNTVTDEVLGTENLVKEDLSNVVDIGNEIFNASAVDNYVKSLINHIGKVVFVNRPYAGSAPSVLMDGWEFGSVLQKINAELPEAQENESWDLVDNASYDPNVFKKPQVSTKFFNKKVTFEIQMSFTEMQVKESFSSVEQLNGFMSMLYTAIDKSMTVKLDSLIMRTINNMIGETVFAEYGSANINSKSTTKAVNLLYLYNQQYSKNLTAAAALTDPDFIRYAAYVIGMTANRMSKISKIFNVGGKDRFTPADYLHVVMLTDFKKAADVFLQSGTFNDEFTRLPKAEEVPYWQGSGTGYAFADTSKVYIKTASGHDETITGVLGVMFDRDAVGVTNMNRRVTANYNPKAEFFNNWFKYDAGYFNDLNENFVVFFVA